MELSKLLIPGAVRVVGQLTSKKRLFQELGELAAQAYGMSGAIAIDGLQERERELVILRTGFNCGSGYEFTQHTRIGLDAGLTEAEIESLSARIVGAAARLGVTLRS